MCLDTVLVELDRVFSAVAKTVSAIVKSQSLLPDLSRLLLWFPAAEQPRVDLWN